MASPYRYWSDEIALFSIFVNIHVIFRLIEQRVVVIHVFNMQIYYAWIAVLLHRPYLCGDNLKESNIFLISLGIWWVIFIYILIVLSIVLY